MGDDRLDSWKEIAGYLKRDVTTVQRWEKREGMPVHRHLHDRLGSVYAFRAELDAWAASRTPVKPQDDKERDAPPRTRRPWPVAAGAAAAVLTLLLGYAWLRARTEFFWRNPVANAQLKRVTDAGGVEQAAAISRDGRFIAFQSDRAGRMDVWLKQAGAARFVNLTNGRFPQLVNDQVRTVGFSPDGALVTFWARGADGSVGIWAIPVLGGEPLSYLENAAEFDWSKDGSSLVYHTAAAGDPTLLRKAAGGAADRQLFKAAAGLHAHFPVWSPDARFIYFVQAAIVEGDIRSGDIWRVKTGDGAAERITYHDSRVTHPVLLDDRTLLYLATDADGSGPWLYSIDVERRVPHRLSPSVDAYTSLAASADGRNFVLTVARPRGTLWRVPLADQPVDATQGSPIPLTTGRGFFPRLGPDSLVYVAATEAGDGIWKIDPAAGATATSVWTQPGARIVGAPAIDWSRRRMAFSVERDGRTLLYAMNLDGTAARVVSSALALVGSPAWQPNGNEITTAASVNGAPRLFRVLLDGAAAPLGQDYAVDPVWSQDGRILVYSGPDVGTSFVLKAMTADGAPYRLPSLNLTRGARRVRFVDQGRALVIMRGDMKHKDLWSINLASGEPRQLTRLPPGFDVNDFDIASDGREVVLERVQAQSEIVLLTLR